MKPQRIAFLTPEYVTRQSNQGGLASYLHNIARSLVALGHQVTIFVGGGDDAAKPFIHDQITVHDIPPADNPLTRVMGKLADTHWRISDLYRGTLQQMRVAVGLALALEVAHDQRPFDWVQSSEHGLAGLFVQKKPGRKQLVRCSSPGDLYMRINGGRRGCDARLLLALERRCIARADIAYAPSRYTARHYREQFGFNVEVLRPPLFPVKVSSRISSDGLPEKYLLFMGKLGRLKGTDLLAQALKKAWQYEPGLTMVWAGAEAQAGVWQTCSEIMGERAGQVRWLGAVERDRLSGIVAQAQATVLPSRCDNLPNTMLESLSLGIPVIGSATGGFDEIIEPGFNGKLVPCEDTDALAQALIATWRGDLAQQRGKNLCSPAMRAMEPLTAARNLLQLAGVAEPVTHDTPMPQRQAA